MQSNKLIWLLPVVIIWLLTGFVNLSYADTDTEAAAKRDPTRPPGYQDDDTSAPAALKVGAIFYSHGRKAALVNSRHVQQGDEIYGAKVVQIKPEGVIVQSQDKGEYEVPLSRGVRVADSSKS